MSFGRGDNCGYIGGASADHCYGIAVDAAGSAYVTGETGSNETSFPVTVGPDLTYNGNGTDAFVAKVNAAGTALVYCGYLGGASDEGGSGIAVDAAGNAYVAGRTASSEKTFPVRSGPDLTYNGGWPWDAFVAKVNAAGTALDYCGYLGGAGYESGNGIAVDTAGNAYVAGETSSDERTFPVKVGPDLSYNGHASDAFVAKVNVTGTALVYCGYLGGARWDQGFRLAVDAAGNAYVTGKTASDEQTFPVTVGPDLTHNGGARGEDAFVAKVNASGTALVYCGFLGGAGDDEGFGVAVDQSGNALVAGTTDSSEVTFPVAVGPDLTYNGGAADAFVAKIALTLLEASGAPRPGGTISFALTSTDSSGRTYQIGSSLGTGPIQIGSLSLGLSPDHLLAASVSGLLPGVFSGYRGVIDPPGRATAALNIPAIPALIGTRVYSAFVTLDPAAPSGIRSISNTFMFTVGK